jgi:hypothetical protein
MNSDPFQLRIPNTFMGNGAVENVGELAAQLGGRKALIITDTGIAQAGLVDHVKQSLDKKKIRSGIFDGCQPDALISVIKQCAQFAAKGGYVLRHRASPRHGVQYARQPVQICPHRGVAGRGREWLVH